MKRTAQHALLGLTALTGGFLLTATAPSLLPPAYASSPISYQAQANTMLSSPVTDETGVLSADEISRIEDAIATLQSEESLTVRVALLHDFGGSAPSDWAEAAVAQSGGGNTGVIAIAIDTRQYAVAVGSQWSDSQLDALDEGVLSGLQDLDWAAAAINGIEAVSHNTISGPSAAWLGAGGVAAVGVGGGAIWYTRRNRKKQDAANLASARDLDPADTRAIMALPINTLEERAEEIIVSTDESVRLAREELHTATEEFGAERVRPFTRAMNTANTALQKAYETQAKLNDAIPETDAEKREMLTSIISSCGQAENALAEQSEKFVEMRNLLLTADKTLDELTQRSIALRTRMEPAVAILEELHTKYSATALSSIAENDDAASTALTEGEEALNRARTIHQQPAGEQAGLIDEIHAAERALNLTDTYLEGIEHAEKNIADAQANLPALIQEVHDEIAEAADLRARGTSHNAPVDWEKLTAAVTEAQSTLERTQSMASTDPLTAYTELMLADSQLDDILDVAREKTNRQERRLAMLDQQLQAAAGQIQSAEDLIASRGRIVRSSARTHLASAQQSFSQAQHLRLRDTDQSIEAARAATTSAQRAISQANNDIDDYRRRQAARTSGDLVQGMVLGALLSGGGSSRGGGRPRGGGGFSGGGGIRSRGGSF